MQNTAQRQPRTLRLLALTVVCGLTAVGLVGCDQPTIRKYTAPREEVVPDFTRLAGYKLPEGWTRLAQPKDDLTLVAFKVGEGDKAVDVTISRFGGRSGGLFMNIERWRGKVGLPSIDEEQMRKELLWLKVDDEKTPYADLSNPKKSDADRILGVVAQRGPVTWFFKMQGPPELVSQHKTAFEAFVESVKFGGPGAKDG